jgi:hypothetical protein
MMAKIDRVIQMPVQRLKYLKQMVRVAVEELDGLFSEKKLGRRILKKMFIKNLIPDFLPQKKKVRAFFIVGGVIANINKECGNDQLLAILTSVMDEKYPSRLKKVAV